MLDTKGNNRTLLCRLCNGKIFAPVYYLDEIEIVRCNHCGLIQFGRYHALVDLKGHYSYSDMENINVHSRFNQNKIVRASRFRADFFQKYTGLRRGKVLEVGSSEGHFLHEMKIRGFDVVGIEPSPVGVLKSSEKGITVINDLVEKANLSDTYFDAVCMFQVMEHFENPIEIFHLLHSKIIRGGYIMIETPDIYSLGAKFEKKPHKLFNKEHITCFSPEQLNALLTSVGFMQIIACHYDYDGFRVPYAKSIKKIFAYITNPKLEGPLQKILENKIDIHYRSTPRDEGGTVSIQKERNNKQWIYLKDIKKTLTAPFDIFFGYIAYRLELGASYIWVGKKS